MTARVLFVDDEDRLLHGLRRALYARRVPWQADFANSGQAALERLGEKSYDAVVADMHMDPMDGAELLRSVRERHPETLRFMLSGHVQTEAAVRALQVAQQLLSKPCDTQTLVDTVERGLAMRERLANPLVRRTLGGLKTLPSAPQVHAQVSTALLDQKCDAARIAGILSRDPAIAANVLHLANSAFFSSGGRSSGDLQQAVIRVGLTTISDLVLATEVFDSRIHGGRERELRNRSLQASRLAARIAAGRPDAGIAATAALLANIGYLLPGVENIQTTDELLSEHAHAELGAALLGFWSLPLTIVEAVAYHHAPRQLPCSEFGTHGIVHVATSLADGVEPDGDYLAEHGLDTQFEAWRAMCGQERCAVYA